MYLRDVADVTIREDGGTFDYKRGVLDAPKTGYAVSYRGGMIADLATTSAPAARLQDRLAVFTDERHQALTKPGHYLGTWLHRERVHLDVTRVFQSLEQAMRFARREVQIAIYDLESGKEIAVE